MTPPTPETRSSEPQADSQASSRPLFRSDEQGGLTPARGPADAQPGPHLAAANAALQAFVEHKAYPCVGAKAAVSRGSYVLSIYPSLGDVSAAGTTAEDIRWFGEHADGVDDSFATFVAVFSEASVPDDAGFESMLWAYLQAMHRADAAHAGWDPSVSPDPADPDFRYSIGGTAFFVIGMHPNAGREARRFPFPAIVFNLHRQFEKLRAEGQFEKMRTVIRSREESLAGEPNPVLADHGERSEASQYAGLAHPPGWRPPFEPLTDAADHADPADNGGAGSTSTNHPGQENEEPSHDHPRHAAAPSDRRSAGEQSCPGRNGQGDAGR
jgi:FPC/CPF motif-containing protein YcgG